MPSRKVSHRYILTKARSTCYGPNDIGSNVTQFKSYPNNITILMISLSDLFISQLSLYFDRVHSSSLSSSSSTPTASLRSVLMFSSKSLKSMLVSSPPASRETTSLPTSESVSNRLFPPAPEPLLIFIFLISSLKIKFVWVIIDEMHSIPRQLEAATSFPGVPVLQDQK